MRGALAYPPQPSLSLGDHQETLRSDPSLGFGASGIDLPVLLSLFEPAQHHRDGVEAKDNREVTDITKLNAELKTTVSRIDQLRQDIDAIVAEIEGGESEGEELEA